MANSKVQLADGTVLMDLTEDTVQADGLIAGLTAHGADGELITGVVSLAHAGSSTPLMDGEASVGVSDDYAREDHVHPENPEMALKSVSEKSGPAVIFENGSDDVEVDALTIGIEPFKNYAEPVDSSASPITFPISGWTGLTLQRSKKNLFDKNNYNYINASLGSGTSGTLSNSSSTFIYFPCKNGVTYKISRKKLSSSDTIKAALLIDEPSVGSTYSNAVTIPKPVPAIGTTMKLTITATENYKYIGIEAWNTASVDPEDTMLITIDADSLNYEEYSGNTYQITWEDAGTVYGGKIKYNGSGVWTLISDTVKKRVNSDLGYVTYNENYIEYIVDDMAPISSADAMYDNCYLCDTFEKVAASGNPGIMFDAYGPAQETVIYFQKIDTYGIVNTLEGWNDFLSEHEVYVTYRVKEPQVYTITTNQLITTLSGYNTFIADTGDIDITYYNENLENIIVKNVRPASSSNNGLLTIQDKAKLDELTGVVVSSTEPTSDNVLTWINTYGEGTMAIPTVSEVNSQYLSYEHSQTLTSQDQNTALANLGLTDGSATQKSNLATFAGITLTAVRTV